MNIASTTIANEHRCPLMARYRITSYVCLAVTVFITLLGLVGWFSSITIIGSLKPGWQPMVPGTGLILLTYSVLIYAAQRNRHRFGWISRLFTILAMLLALVSIVMHQCFPNAPHDWIVFEDFYYKGPLRSHLSPITSLLSLITGVALLLWFAQRPRLTAIAGWLNIGVIITASTFLLAYLYGSPLLYGTAVVPIALSTSIAFLLLGIALLCTFGPDVAPVSMFTDGTTRARLLSAFLPVVVLLTFLADILPDRLVKLAQANHALHMAFLFVFITIISVRVVTAIANHVGFELDNATAEVHRARTSERAEKERLLVTLHSIGDGVIVSDTASKLIMLNPVAETLTGWTQEEAVGRPVSEVFDIVNETTRAVAESPIAKVLDTGLIEGLTNHTVLRARNGTEYAIADSGAPIRAMNGDILGVVLVFRDVTSERLAEVAMQEKDYFLTASQRVALIGSYKLDFATGLWESSEVLDQIFGIDAQYQRNIQGWLDIAHPDDAEEMGRQFQDTIDMKQHQINRDWRIRRISDGTEMWVHGIGEVEFDADGRHLTMLGTVQDISINRLMEEEQASLQAQLQQAQKMESVGRLAGGVAHDFNNMLGVILGNLQLAMESVDPESSLHDDLTEIQVAAERSADLTRQLLAFARKQTIAPKKLNLNDTIEGMLKMLQRMIGENILLVWRPMTDLWNVKMDPSQIDQMLTNLCVNARDAIEGHGVVTVETSNIAFDESFCADHPQYTPGEFVKLAVSDDGCGMNEMLLSQIFEPFFTTKGVGEGTGLGLATVYGAVKQNDGFIIAASTVGQGTCFNIYLPRHTADTENAQMEYAMAPIVGGQETILLVEDEPAILRMTKLMLQRSGYTVISSTTPSHAIRLAEEYSGEIQVVLTDVVMPEMNGKDMVNELISHYPDIKRIFMSGYTADIIADQGKLDIGEYFIQKPFTNRDLNAKIRQALAE